MSGADVTHVMRRVYLDSHALVRFDLGIFSNPEYTNPGSRLDLRKVAKDFWKVDVHTKDGKQRSETSLWNAALRLVEKFGRATSQPGHPFLADDCRVLAPLVQIIAAAPVAELERLDWSSAHKGLIRVKIEALELPGWPEPVDTAYIVYPVGYITTTQGSEFKSLRLLRAHLAWMHSDLAMLSHILECGLQREVPFNAIESYARELATRLLVAGPVEPAEQDSLAQMIDVLEHHHANPLSLLAAALRDADLPPDVRDELVSALERRVPAASGAKKGSDRHRGAVPQARRRQARRAVTPKVRPNVERKAQDGVDFVVVTALHKELKPLLEVFDAKRLPKSLEDINQYYEATVDAPGRIEYSVRLFTIGEKGESYTAALISDAISRWKPAHLIMTGIAATIPGERREIGDLLVAEKIADLSSFDILPTVVQVRDRIYPCDRELVGAVKDFLMHDSWSPPVHTGTIISQTALVKSARFRDWLATHVPGS